MKAAGQIILIEPSESGREMLAERLRMQGYAVTVAPGPAEGAHLALSSPPTAVVAEDEDGNRIDQSAVVPVAPN